MLRTRIITASILGIAFLIVLFALSSAGWMLATSIVMLISLWEWSKISKLSRPQTIAFLAVSALLGVAILFILDDALPSDVVFIFSLSSIIATLFWVLIVPLWLKFGWRPQNKLVLCLTGWLVIFPTWFAFIEHRIISPWLLLGLMGLVWVCDISAYFTGKAFGRHKLAPSISPGKTWEGVWGAMVGVLIYALICFGALRYFNKFSELESLSWAIIIFGALSLAIVSIIGDLFESWMKRGAGLKDSSNLLPGHGGVLDRIDALTSTLPIASCLFFVLTKVAYL